MRVLELYKENLPELIQLSERDWEVLKFLEQQGVATLNQLLPIFKSTRYATKRIRALVKAGFLSKQTVLEFLSRTSVKTNFPHLMETRLSSRTQVYYLADFFRRRFAFSDALIKPNLFMHQLLLNDLRLKIEELIPARFILSDPHIKSLSKIEGWRHAKIRPDLSFEFQDFKLAIELERTLKCKSRYLERFLYLQSSIYSHVIYFTANKRNLDFLLSICRGFSKIGVATMYEPKNVYHNYFGLLDIEIFMRKKL